MYAKAAFDEAFEELPDPAFILHTGDVVEEGGNKAMWNWYFKTLGEHGASVPHFAAIGNHDTWANGPLYFDLHFNHPNNGGTAALDKTITQHIDYSYLKTLAKNADETIYSFDYGDVHFTVLNTGSYHSEDRYIIEAQRKWLEKDLEESKTAKWKVILLHEPVYHRKGGAESRPWLHDLIEAYGVDLVIQGHSHLVTRSYPMKGGKIVTKSYTDVVPKGTGTVYTTIGSTALNHDGVSDSQHVEEMFNVITPTATQSSYTIVKVTEKGLSVVSKQINGLVLDEFTIAKEGEKPVEDPRYTFENGVLTLKQAVEGDYKNEGATDTFPWANIRDQITKVVVADGVIEIPHHSFTKCPALTEIVTGKDCVKIGDDAFSHNEALKTITFGANIEEIGQGIAFGSNGIEKITLKEQTADEFKAIAAKSPYNLESNGGFSTGLDTAEYVTAAPIVPPSTGSNSVEIIFTVMGVSLVILAAEVTLIVKRKRHLA